MDLSKNFIDVTRDLSIHRVFSMSRALELVRNKELTLVNPSLWDDPFDNLLLNADAVDEQGTPVSLEILRSAWYGQCWTSGSESDAMWRIYSPNKDGVRISTTVGKLFDAVCPTTDDWSALKFFIGRVEYHQELARISHRLR